MAWLLSRKEGLQRDKWSGLLPTILQKMSVTNKPVARCNVPSARHALAQRSFRNVIQSHLSCLLTCVCPSTCHLHVLCPPPLFPHQTDPHLLSRPNSEITVFLSAFQNNMIPQLPSSLFWIQITLNCFLIVTGMDAFFSELKSKSLSIEIVFYLLLLHCIFSQNGLGQSCGYIHGANEEIDKYINM